MKKFKDPENSPLFDALTKVKLPKAAQDDELLEGEGAKAKPSGAQIGAMKAKAGAKKFGK